MPAVTSGLILVTGASGFVGTYTTRALLEAGYSVRGVVRSEAKGKYLQSLYPGQKVEYAVVPDMIEPGAYDAAVVGIDGVIHASSPLNATHPGDPNDVIIPAVKGVTGILSSLDKVPGAKRIVTLSSIAAVRAITTAGPHTFTEKDWNDVSLQRCEELGAKASGGDKYSASKAAAERAFWKFFENAKKPFDAVALNPSYIFGPPSQYTDSESAIVGSNALFLPFFRPGFPASALGTPFAAAVDVRDVATAAVRALSLPEAAGERYLIVAAPLFANDFALAVNKARPEADVTKGNPDPEFRAKLDANAVIFDGSKAAKAFGLTYRSKDATLEETAKALAAKL